MQHLSETGFSCSLINEIFGIQVNVDASLQAFEHASFVNLTRRRCHRSQQNFNNLQVHIRFNVAGLFVGAD